MPFYADNQGCFDRNNSALVKLFLSVSSEDDRAWPLVDPFDGTDPDYRDAWLQALHPRLQHLHDHPRR